MPGDYIYTRAPLVEVIAEVHWQLKPIPTSPEAKIDPYFELFKEQFLGWSSNKGFRHHEQLVPKEIPIELLADQVHLRLRTEQGRWPLYQIGPGVLTCNIVPPYKGWPEFRPHLDSGVGALFDHYPLSNKTLRVSRVELHYINLFTSDLGLDDYARFVGEELGAPSALPQQIREDYVASGLTTVIDSRFQCRKPANSQGAIRISPGNANNRPAVVLELICRKLPGPSVETHNSLIGWFDEAHLAIRSWFESQLSEPLKTRIGPKVPVGGAQ